jgi:hypothetical protein
MTAQTRARSAGVAHAEPLRGARGVGRAALNAAAGRLVGPVAEASTADAMLSAWATDSVAGWLAVAAGQAAPAVRTADLGAALHVADAPLVEPGAVAFAALAHVGAALPIG